MLQNFIRAYYVLACVLMEATAQSVHDLYIRAVLNTSFLNDGTPIKIFNETNKALLVVTDKGVFSVTIEEQSGLAQGTFAVTNARLVKAVTSLYDVIMMNSNQLLYSDETTCLKTLKLNDGAIEPYVGSCTESGNADGPRLQARFGRLRCLLRVNTIIYMVDVVEKSIRMMTLNPTSQIATVFRDRNGYMISPGFMSACDANTLYLTVEHGVVEIVISDDKARFIAGSQTPGIGDNIAVDFYQQKETTNAFDRPRGIIVPTPQLLVVADFANNRVRFVFPVISLNQTWNNITQSVCIEGTDRSKDGSLQNCSLGPPHSVNLVGNRILIGEKNVLRISPDYKDVYRALSQKFGNSYTGLIRPNTNRFFTYQSTTPYPGFPASLAFDGVTDLKFSHTEGANNQWWKVYIVDIPIYLDKIELYYRPERGYYSRMKDLFVLTSILTDATNSNPSLNDPDWPECFYRSAIDSDREQIVCNGEKPLSHQIAVYVRENNERGVALREVLLFGSWRAEVASIIAERCSISGNNSVTINPSVTIIGGTRITNVIAVTDSPTSLPEQSKAGSGNIVPIVVGTSLGIASLAGIIIGVCIKRRRGRQNIKKPGRTRKSRSSQRLRSGHKSRSTHRSLSGHKSRSTHRSLSGHKSRSTHRSLSGEGENRKKRRKKHHESLTNVTKDNAEILPSIEPSNLQAGGQGVTKRESELAAKDPSPAAVSSTILVKRSRHEDPSPAATSSIILVKRSKIHTKKHSKQHSKRKKRSKGDKRSGSAASITTGITV